MSLPLEDTIRRQFEGKVVKAGECWVWTAYRDQHGYGRVNVTGMGVRPAHRVLYEVVIGPVPDGLELDHLCCNPACVRPDHLEPVTHAENVRRGRVGQHNATKTECRRGHPLSGENLYINPTSGSRQCRECQRHHEREYRRRKA